MSTKIENDFSINLQQPLDTENSENTKKIDIKFPKTKQTEDDKNKTKIEKLHEGWAEIMKEEAKNHIPAFKPDPNISLDFFKQIEKVSKDLNIDPEDLAAIIYEESHFDPKCKNPTGKYCGLIQMDKTTFNHIFPNDITYEKYCSLPREKQLKYTEGYLKYRIKEKGFEGQKISGGLLWTLIKRPASSRDQNFINKHQKKIDTIKQKPKNKLNIKS